MPVTTWANQSHPPWPQKFQSIFFNTTPPLTLYLMDVLGNEFVSKDGTVDGSALNGKVVGLYFSGTFFALCLMSFVLKLKAESNNILRFNVRSSLVSPMPWIHPQAGRVL